MRTHQAIDTVSKQIIKDNICEAIIVKGSIGRGDDDEYSDVDMYAIVAEENMNNFLEKRLEYLSTYKEIVYYSHANFVGPQIVAIFEDGLHFDLYTVTRETLPKTDKAKVIYDPSGIMADYCQEKIHIDDTIYINLFNDTLYNFVEANGAYKRKNYPWATQILDYSVAQCATLLVHNYNKDYAYLGLKKAKDVLPEEQYLWLERASENLHQKEYEEANRIIIQMLEYVFENSDEYTKNKLNVKFLEWTKKSLDNKVIF